MLLKSNRTGKITSARASKRSIHKPRIIGFPTAHGSYLSVLVRGKAAGGLKQRPSTNEAGRTPDAEQFRQVNFCAASLPCRLTPKKIAGVSISRLTIALRRVD